MAGGRPTEYLQEYCDKVDEYIAERADEEYEYHKTRGEKSDSYERKIKVKLPTIEGFALFIGVSKRVLYEWEAKYPEFLHALDKIRTEQHNRLIDWGLSGDYNPTIAKLILSSNHGMREKSDVTTDGQAINVTFDSSFNK
jgi:hypothetical protein